MSQVSKLEEYITEHEDDSHISEAMVIVGADRPQLLALAKCVSPDILMLSREFSRFRWSRRDGIHRVVEWLMEHKLIAAVKTDFKTPRYTFTVAGYTGKGELVKVVECGDIVDRKNFYLAASAIGRVWHWPTGDVEPHKLAGCPECRRFKVRYA